MDSIKPKKKPMKLEEMSKEQIRQAIIKKRECNAKAQQIVESLLEEDVTDSYLLKCLPDINQSHFDDVIEERSIVHLCGYPVCTQKISVKDIPKQKYRISMKTNKVYDVTGRKSFCSNRCYNAAMYVKKQMLTSPLWFREYEEIPKFCLLPLESTLSMGQEVDVSLIDKVKVKENKPFTSTNDFAEASFAQMKINDDELNVTDESVAVKNKANDNNSDQVTQSIKKRKPSVDNNEEEKASDENKMDTNEKEKIEIKNPPPNLFNIVGEIIERPEKKIDPIITQHQQQKEVKQKKMPQKKQPLVTALSIEVEKCLAQWFTLDTLLFLYGDEKVREMVEDKGECIKEYLNNFATGIFYNSNAYDQYQQLCKKLNMLELEDKKQDAQTLQREMKPLPDFSILKEESKKMQLKVKAFLAGETEIPLPEPEERNEESEDEVKTHLPLVDKNAQNALRRRIVCQHLNKVLPDLLRSLGLLTLTISTEIRLLVNTFKLKADNIMFKPIQWTLIALLFIKLLSIRDKRLEYLLEQPMAFQHMQLLLLSYKQDGGYLDRLISWLTDVDRLLDTDDTQLTVEVR